MTLPSIHLLAGGGADSSALGAKFAGKHAWREADSGAFLDIETIDLRADGTYIARVEATLVNPAVRSFGAPCMLVEQGLWSAYKVAGETKIRLRPSTNKARVYVAAYSVGRLSLSRRGTTTVLYRDAVVPAAVA